MHEPEQWKKAQEKAAQDRSQATGKMGDLFNSQNMRSTVVGVTLATIGLVTFWGATFTERTPCCVTLKGLPWWLKGSRKTLQKM